MQSCAVHESAQSSPDVTKNTGLKRRLMTILWFWERERRTKGVFKPEELVPFGPLQYSSPKLLVDPKVIA
jgi:hypothetical protein